MRSDRHSVATAVVVTCLFVRAAAAFDLTDDLFSKLDAIPGTISTTLNAASEYDYRGMSLSDRLPVGQASLDYALDSGPFAGIWTSNVDFGGDDPPSIELDYYGGIDRTVAGTELSATVLYYTYPVLDDVRSYAETFFQARRTFEPVELKLFVAYAWNFNGASTPGVYPRFNSKVQLPYGFKLATHVGYQWSGDVQAVGTPHYFDWSFGVRYTIWGVDLTLAYVDTTLTRAECGHSDNCEARPVFTVSRTFSTGGRTEERRDDVGRGY